MSIKKLQNQRDKIPVKILLSNKLILGIETEFTLAHSDNFLKLLKTPKSFPQTRSKLNFKN